MTNPILFTLCQQQLILQTEIFAKSFMKDYDWSHDYYHAVRVKKLATKIAITESLNNNEIFEVQLGALLHDINDDKYNVNNISQNQIIRDFYKNKDITQEVLENVVNIACNTSLSKELHSGIEIRCKKLDCVRDADRIESLGAIGISRYFKYGITKQDKSLEDIIVNLRTRTSILVDHIKTDTGKKIAKSKLELVHMFLEDYYNSLN